MNEKSVRISNLANEFGRSEKLLEKMFAACWGNSMTLRRVLTDLRNFSDEGVDPIEACKFAAVPLRQTWVAGNESPFVDKLTLTAIATLAKDAPQGDAILKIILAGDSED